ncbi:MAG: hypothetical protein RID93_40475 [Sandaracinaceae bacterium]
MRWPVVVRAPRYIEPNATYAICCRVEEKWAAGGVNNFSPTCR